MTSPVLTVPTIRELLADDLPAAYLVVRQLREHLDLQQFQQRIEKQKKLGYVLYGAFDVDGGLRGVMGMRPVTTLARGDHLHVDDLVVDRGVRGAGFGKALLQFAERWAARHALRASSWIAAKRWSHSTRPSATRAIPPP